MNFRQFMQAGLSQAVFVIDQRWNQEGKYKYTDIYVDELKWENWDTACLIHLSSSSKNSEFKLRDKPHFWGLEASRLDGVTRVFIQHRVIAHNFNYCPVSTNAF